MEIRDSHFYTGPSLWGSQSGLCLTLALTSDETHIFAHTLTFDEWQNTQAVLSHFPAIKFGLPTSDNTRSPSVFYLAAALQQSFQVLPAIGWLIDQTEEGMRLFLPCDDPNTGWFALNLAVEILTHAKDNLALSADTISKFLAFARSQSLSPEALSFARAAHHHGVPYVRHQNGGLQLGQGERGHRLDATTLEKMTEEGAYADKVISHLYPDPMESRIPIAGITGSIGKTTTARMVASIFANAGKTVAFATTQGTSIGNETIRKGDSAAGIYARQLLQDPRVQIGVFELARGGLVHNGLGLDSLNVGACLNVYDNHLGLSGIVTRDDLARIKRLVIENARDMAVLNADDPLCLAMRHHTKARRLCLVSEYADHPAIKTHREAGGVIVSLSANNETIELYDGEKQIGAFPVTDIPATFGGRFRPALVCALFATAIAYGLGGSFGDIQSGLSAFKSNYESNPGRMNFFEGLPYQVLITHADGPEAVAEIARFVENIDVAGHKRILFGALGNRSDDYILSVARNASGSFTRYICADGRDLRGRIQGEIPNLLATGLINRGVAADRIAIATDYEDAIRIAFQESQAGDLLVFVISPFDFEDVWSRALQEVKHRERPAAL